MDLNPPAKFNKEIEEGDGDGVNLKFNIMPRSAAALGSKTAKPAEVPLVPAPTSPIKKSSRLNLKKLLVTLGVLIVLGIVAYWVYVNYFQNGQANPTAEINVSFAEEKPPLPEVDLRVKLDEDNDGLTLEEEQLYNSDPQNADTDGDGLADGDEVNIFNSDPLLFDSDGDGFADGREVSRGFSPIQNSPDPIGEDEKVAWELLIGEYGLHNPSISTVLPFLPEQTGDVEKQFVTYLNQSFGYQFNVPEGLAFREDPTGQTIGLYVKKNDPVTNLELPPEDDNLLSDPINIVTAVKTSNQTLLDWVNTQYPANSYKDLEEVNINSIQAYKVDSLATEESSCPMNKAFFAKNDLVIVLTLTCNESDEFVQLYEEIITSFQFN